jgi:hypothetical protein
MSNNHLSKDKQIAVTAALAEGNSIRSIERMTGIHRDTIMRLGVRIGQGCARLLDQKMRNLNCNGSSWTKFGDLLARKSVTCAKTTIQPLATFGRIALSTRRLKSFLRTRLPASALSPAQSNLSATLNHDSTIAFRSLPMRCHLMKRQSISCSASTLTMHRL